jgi:DNA-binding transcriptional LysR family regulator
MEPPESLAALSSHQIDLAIIGYIGELMTIPDELTAIELGTDQLQVLLHDRNPLAAQTGVSIADLREQDWAMEPQGAYLTDRLWRLCQDAGYQPRQVATFQDYAAIRAAVQHHFAIGVLPGIAIPTHLSHVRAVPLVPHQRRHFYLVSRRAQARLQPLVLTKQAIQGVGEQVLQ